MIRTILIVGGAWFVAATLFALGFWLLLVADSWRTRRRRRIGFDMSRGIMHLPQAEIPGTIRECARTVLEARGFWVVDRQGEMITDERFEGLLRELGNNATQGLYSVDLNEENF